MAAPTTRLVAPVAIAVVVGLGDLAEAGLGLYAENIRRNATVAGASSWAALYLFGIEAAAGVLILALAVIAAGRSPRAATGAAGLAWLRLVAVAATAFLMIFGIGFAGPFDASDAYTIALALLDALAGALICSSIARRTRLRHRQ